MALSRPLSEKLSGQIRVYKYESLEVLYLMPKISSSSLVGKLKEGEFLTLGEIEVNSQTSLDRLEDKAKNLQNSVDAVIVRRDPRASLYLNTLIPCYLIKEKVKLESIYGLDSRDQNRLGLLSDILTASQLGLTNIIVSTGTHTTTGAYAKAKPVFDLDTVQLITMIKEMNNGKAFTGEAITKPTSFEIGAVLGFDHSRPEMQEVKIRKAKSAGASYLLTLPVYDSENAKMIANQTSKAGMPLVITLYPIDSVDTANWINKLYPSSKPPEDFINKIEDIEKSSSKAEVRSKGITETNVNFVSTLIRELRAIKGVSGCNVVSTRLDTTKVPF
jgi:methylenetetrahydrofolate reductase (NADPH)